ncbi:MAG: N-acetylmuramate alpha-1-phosphate uridylyltransferase MurU [Pseudomonadota bacterium]
MKAMILAAGEGRRMLPLSQDTPKPLLTVGGKPLIVHLLEHLVRHGFDQIVINHARLGEQFEEILGNGQQFGACLRYSREGDTPLETGGGMLKALPLLDNAPFLAVSGDLYTNYPFSRLPKSLGGKLAHLVLTDNPPHHPAGDFVLNHGKLSLSGGDKLNFGGIGIYHPDLIKDRQLETFSIAPLLLKAAQAGQISGEHYTGTWFNIGNPEQLKMLDGCLSEQSSDTR